MSNLDERGGLPGLTYPEAALQRLATELSTQYEGTFGQETIERYVLESYTALLRTSVVKAHLITRTDRFAKDRLAALAQAKGAIGRHVPEILFVCEQNAGRSQLAALLTSALSGGAVHVRSAGTAPAAYIHDDVEVVMGELMLDASESFPKPLTDDVVQAADVVITMGCGDACPVYPGKRYEDWQLPDPAGHSLDEVRAIRDQIQENVENLLTGLGITPVPSEQRAVG